MVAESCVCGKCIERTLLLKQTHFSEHQNANKTKIRASFIFNQFF